MSPVPLPEEIADALGRRVERAGVALQLADWEKDAPTPENIRALLKYAAESSRSDVAWLTYVALSASIPDRDSLSTFQRNLEFASEQDLVARGLETVAGSVSWPGRTLRDIEIVGAEEMLVDVTFCSTHDHNTGIQRVVRGTIPQWEREDRPIRLVRWSPSGGGYTGLDEREAKRVLDWSSVSGIVTQEAQRRLADDRPLLVPWHTRVFLPEVPAQHQCAELACIAESSGTSVSLLGYDTIPIGSADMLPPLEAERFAKYLDVVKRSSLVMGISRTAAAEFAGFASALPVQGLTPPRVVAVPLAVDVPADAHATEVPTESEPLPVVICVGSHEPRKNQDAVLAAAEVLYQEGLRFRLVFVGGGSRQATSRFDAHVRHCVRRGMVVESHRRLSDADLWVLYRQARFSVFVSLHEGFGLPVAESIVLGAPVLTSNFGSLAEIAADGGCVSVDPRDDIQIIDGMRALLTDDDLIQRLRLEASAAPRRSWSEYAAELWHELESAAA